MARFAVARLANLFIDSGANGFPWGTFLANFLACILLGFGLSLASNQQLSPSGQFLLVTGFCGGFSTFSTFSAELLYLMQQGQTVTVLAYLFASLFVGVGSIFLVLFFTAATNS